MYKNYLVMFLFILLSGCEKPQPKPDPELADMHLPESTSPQTSNPMRDEENFPNASTTTEWIQTTANNDIKPIITALGAYLKRDHFQLKASNTGTDAFSLNDCRQNKILRIQGTGIQSYWAKRSKGIGQNKDYFPDFHLEVLSLSSTQQAEATFKRLQQALASSNGFCNGKSPIKLVQKDQHIFYFGTRAEMFRGYINTYAEWIEQYSAR